MDKYFAARSVLDSSLAGPYANKDTRIGHKYYGFITNAIVADDWYLVRAYLTVLAQRPWWLRNMGWSTSDLTDQNIERAHKMVQYRVDRAVQHMQMALARDWPYDVVAEDGMVMATQLPNAPKHGFDNENEDQERHRQEDRQEDREERAAQADVVFFNEERLRNQEDFDESDPELEDAD